MTSQLKVGDCVRLVSVPDWVVHDLPATERQEILSFVGKETVVTEIDSYGYFWVGFGSTVDCDDSSRYSGHSFCVTRESLEQI
jgi:hypothetical protein